MQGFTVSMRPGTKIRPLEKLTHVTPQQGTILKRTFHLPSINLQGTCWFSGGTSAHYTFHNKFNDIQKHPLTFMPPKKSNHNIVDGHNPAPVALVNIPRITMFDPGRLDVFLHQRLSSHMAPFIPLRRIHFTIFLASWWPNDQRLRQSPAD